MTSSSTPESMILPNPVFEGSEKRVEIDFFLGTAPPAGLRSLSRDQLDHLMSLAACTIVSSRTNEHLDAYVLSESSLFVYPTKWVLKTCGTTKLLAAVPHLLQLAAALGMSPRRCKYSRASFLFPEQQPFPHTSFDQEAFFLRRHFSHLGNGGSAYVLGDMFNGLQWHVYVADAYGTTYEPVGADQPTYKLEVCMTELGKQQAASFFRTEAFVSAAKTTSDSGIAALMPGLDIDDYVFDPCGYSMNGIRGTGFVTIHITPEDGFSYASVEVTGFGAAAYDPSDMIARIARVFRPGRMSVSLSVDVASRNGGYAWGTLAARPHGYGCQSATCQELAAGGRVSFYTLVATHAAGGDGSGGGAAALAKDVPRCDSPVTVLQHMPSFASLPPCTDSDLDMSCGSGDENESGGSSPPAPRRGGKGGAGCGAAAATGVWALNSAPSIKEAVSDDGGSVDAYEAV